MISLTPIQEAFVLLVMTNEGLSAGAIARAGNQPKWRTYPTLRALRDKGVLVDDAARKHKTQDATFWYVHPQYRAALDLPPLDLALFKAIAEDLERGVAERERFFSDELAEQKRAKATIKFEAIPCKHCGQKHCLPKRGRRRKLAAI